MKPIHDKLPVDEFTPGSSYNVGMNGKDLYKAEVLKFHGGCWATVKVLNTLDESVQKIYTPGMEFDIKVAEYSLSKTPD